MSRRRVTVLFSRLMIALAFAVLSLLSAGKAQAAAIVEAAAVDNGSGTAQIVISGVTFSGDDDRLVVPVWSREDQSDIVWYTPRMEAPDRYVVDFSIRNHGSHYGTYYADVYETGPSGTYTYLGGTTMKFSVTRGTTTVKKNIRTGTYALTTTGFSLPGQEVARASFAVWSREGGQDDLTWNTAQYDPSSVTLQSVCEADALAHAGSVYADAYVQLSDGSMVCVDSTSFNHSGNGCESMTIENKNDAAGTCDIVLRGVTVPAGVREILIPVWSTPDQSDIHWYRASDEGGGTWKVKMSLSNHGNGTGLFYADAYVTDQTGLQEYLASQTVQFSLANGGVSVETADGRHYKLTVRSLSIPGGCKGVSFAVWSEKGGQDDLIWYPAEGKNGGNYTAEMDIAKHKTEGAYLIDPYVQTADGRMICLGTCRDLNVTAEADTSVTVSNVKEDAGTFDVTIALSNLSCPVESLNVPVWSKPDQSDIRWYSASTAGQNTWKLTVDMRNHKNSIGAYFIDVYGTFANGLFKYLGGTTQFFNPDGRLRISAPDGSYTRSVSYRTKAADSVVFAVWTKTGDQDDLVWYPATAEGDGQFTAEIRASNHRHNGTYIVHAYAKLNGQQYFADQGSFSMIDYVEYAIGLANDDSHGYSQSNRYMNPDLDCSSLVYYSLYNSGFGSILGNSAFYTGTEVYLLQKCGFSTIEFTGMKDLKPGDILWYRYGTRGHTEIYVGDGYNVGAHDSVVDGVDYPQGGDQTGREVSVSPFYEGHEWIYVLRYYQ